MDSEQTDRRMMRRALALATLGRGTAAPNPFVGAVVARGNTVLGQGFHRLAGEPHAEAIALSQIGSLARGATLYTNLEPCCHTGRTPPCVHEIVLAGVRRVVASMRDPNPKVDGGGFRYLRRHGIEVEIGLLRREAKELNAAFVKHARRGLPYVTLKGAVSLDGRIATRCGDSKWITSKTARRHARVLRAEHDAVLVGIGTALADDPRLNRRPRPRASGPFQRAVLDGSLRLSPTSRLIQTARREPVTVFCAAEASAARKKKLRSAGVTVETIGRRGGRLDLEAALFRLAAGGVSRLLVEGGSEIHGSFLENGLADRLVLYLAPRIVGGRAALPLVGGEGPQWIRDAAMLRSVSCARVGDGWMIDGRFRY